MKDDYFTLLYNKEKKIIKIPKTFKEFKNIFKIEFNESDDNNFSFQYIDTEDDEIILDENNYNDSIEDIKKSLDHLITVYKCDRDEKYDFYKYINLEKEEEDEQEEKKEVIQPNPIKSGEIFKKKKKEVIQPDPLKSGFNFTKVLKKGIKKPDISISKKMDEDNGNKEDEFIPKYDAPSSLTQNKGVKKDNNNLENSSQSNKEVKKTKNNYLNDSIIPSSSEEKDKKEAIILLDTPIPTLKTKQIENDGKKYICKFQIIKESIDVSIYLLSLLKYKGNITLEKIKAQIIQFSENNINEILEEIILLNLNNFSIIKENNKFKLKIKFYILKK